MNRKWNLWIIICFYAIILSSCTGSGSPSENPVGPASGDYRVIRGGSWYDYGWVLRVSFRSRYNPGGSAADGF